jgi:hypothetical protein
VLPSDSVSTSYRYFGQSLSLSSSGDTLVVGAHSEGAAGMVTGAWWHFEWSGTLFEQSGLKKVGQPTSNGADQGVSVALSSDGQTVIGPCPTALAMQLPVRQACLLISFFVTGLFVSLSGAVGAIGESCAYMWARNVSGSTDWQQLSKMTDAVTGSWFGYSVALSGSTMEFVIGGQCAHPALSFDSAVSDARCPFPFALLHVASRARKRTHRNLPCFVE